MKRFKNLLAKIGLQPIRLTKGAEKKRFKNLLAKIGLQPIRLIS